MQKKWVTVTPNGGDGGILKSGTPDDSKKEDAAVKAGESAGEMLARWLRMVKMLFMLARWLRMVKMLFMLARWLRFVR